jgi:redox-sensitive bicupin YhaK (pirin superfamily)
VALPAADEETAPSFAHTPASAIPEIEVGGARLRVLVGEAYGAVSPVAVRSPTLFVDIALGAGDAFPLPPAEERAVYVVEGDAQLDGEDIPPGRMVVLAADEEPMLSADADARVVLIGGTPLGPRHIWWNFVSSRKERITQAADDWAAQRLGVVAGETEFIPLPDKRPG